MAMTPGVKSQGMTFAEEQLQRHGWTEGKGLGKKESGISKAIKVKVKCDNAGVGHNSAEQFTFHWWDHVFNKTASSIAVEPDQDGVQVKKVTEDDSTVTNKKPRKALTNRDMLYGRFIKSATLLSGGEKPVEKESSSDSSEDEDEKLDLSSATKMTDEDLVKICGGRTAHKGARHGLTMSAKLLRIEEQERAFLEKYGKKESKKEAVSSTGGMTLGTDAETERQKRGITKEDISSNTTKCKKKKKKRKKTVNEEETLEDDETNSFEEHIRWKENITPSEKNVDKELVDSSCGEASSDKYSDKRLNHTEKDLKSMKKKKKVASEGLLEEGDDLEGHAPSIEEAIQSSKKKKRKVEEKDVGEELLNGHQEWVPSEDQRSKKKKKKIEKDEVGEELINGHQEWAPSEDQLSKKKKRKLKRDLEGRVKEELDESTAENVQSTKKRKKQRVEEVDEHLTMEEEECQMKKKKSKSKYKDCSMSGEELEQALEGTQHKMKRKKNQSSL